jgi:predicted adenylyl cyclase CyaB
LRFWVDDIFETGSVILVFSHLVGEGGIMICIMAHYEIEIKSLLGSKENADQLIEKMRANDPDSVCIATSTQLNHYFEGGDISKLFDKTKHFWNKEQLQKFETIVEKGADFSVRTRQKDDEVLLVVKASLDEGTSANTVSRLEFEERVGATLDELDALVQEAGFTYQAKWSREREEYAYKGANVCLDKNAGYGFLAEFEKVAEEGSDIAQIRKELDGLMSELGVAELPQDRLERMFAHYNAHWPEYYGTDKTFTIE